MALIKSTKASKKYGISIELVNKVLKSAEIPSIRVGSGKNRTDLFDGAAFEEALTEWIIAHPKKQKSEEQLKKLNKNLEKARKAAEKKRAEKTKDFLLGTGEFTVDGTKSKKTQSRRKAR